MSTFFDAPPYYNGEGIVRELDREISRKSVTLASGAGIVKPMTILGKIAVGGKYVPLNLAAGDGSQNAAAVNVNTTDATAADAAATAITRLATLNGAELIYPAGATAPQKAVIDAALDALMIVVLTGA